MSLTTTIPTPKFNIGDIVYGAEFSPNGECWETCPDCVGQRYWDCTLPSGEQVKLPCATCEQGYQGPQGIVRVYQPKYDSRRLTIGSVRIDTHDETSVSYMCNETGVGSGQIWYEARVFPTAEEAVAAAKQFALDEAARLNAHEAQRRTKKKKDSRTKPDWRETKIANLKSVMAEAVTEITNLDSPDNVVAARLRAAIA